MRNTALALALLAGCTSGPAERPAPEPEPAVAAPAESTPAEQAEAAEEPEALAGLSDAERKLAQTTCSPSFNDTPLASALQFLTDVSGVRIMVDVAVYEHTPADALRVTLQVDEVSGLDTLRLLLVMTNLEHVVHEGRIVVLAKSTKAKIDAGMREKAAADIADLGTALKLYRLQLGRYPESLDALLEPVKDFPEGFVVGLPDDPWGNPYVYEQTDAGYRLLSFGADGEPGGEGADADVTSGE